MVSFRCNFVDLQYDDSVGVENRLAIVQSMHSFNVCLFPVIKQTGNTGFRVFFKEVSLVDNANGSVIELINPSLTVGCNTVRGIKESLAFFLWQELRILYKKIDIRGLNTTDSILLVRDFFTASRVFQVFECNAEDCMKTQQLIDRLSKFPARTMLMAAPSMTLPEGRASSTHAPPYQGHQGHAPPYQGHQGHAQPHQDHQGRINSMVLPLRNYPALPIGLPPPLPNALPFDHMGLPSRSGMPALAAVGMPALPSVSSLMSHQSSVSPGKRVRQEETLHSYASGGYVQSRISKQVKVVHHQDLSLDMGGLPYRDHRGTCYFEETMVNSRRAEMVRGFASSLSGSPGPVGLVSGPVPGPVPGPVSVPMPGPASVSVPGPALPVSITTSGGSKRLALGETNWLDWEVGGEARGCNVWGSDIEDDGFSKDDCGVFGDDEPGIEDVDKDGAEGAAHYAAGSSSGGYHPQPNECGGISPLPDSSFVFGP